LILDNINITIYIQQIEVEVVNSYTTSLDVAAVLRGQLEVYVVIAVRISLRVHPVLPR
jgi:hypothetical protein